MHPMYIYTNIRFIAIRFHFGQPKALRLPKKNKKTKHSAYIIIINLILTGGDALFVVLLCV